jgi:protein gp37
MNRRKPTMIFPCDMGEWCGPWLPGQEIQDMLDVIGDCPQHTFALLTKQTQELPRWAPYPDNVWLGATITNDEQARTALEAFDGPMTSHRGVFFASFEPLHDPIDPQLLRRLRQKLDWVIIGAQTKPRRDPQPETVSTLIEHFERFSTPVFLKDNLAPVVAPWMMEEYRRIPIRKGGPCPT